jgi:hypothetical protein
VNVIGGDHSGAVVPLKMEFALCHVHLYGFLGFS